jgi:Domain of unknown function (DUF4440)
MQRPAVLALGFLSCLASPSTAQRVHKHEPPSSEAERPASDSHSFVELFTKLERGWTQAVQKKDEAAIDGILAPEFMFWTSENPENPMPRADFKQSVLTGYDIRSSSHRTMAIRAFVGVAVVSFVESQQEIIDGKNRTGNHFVIDLWEVNHEKWQLVARYVSVARSKDQVGHGGTSEKLPHRGSEQGC